MRLLVKNSGAVIGTDHAAENLTGFFTKFGDGGADILPLFRLNKRQGAALLAELGADKALYEKVPTADLEEDKPGRKYQPKLRKRLRFGGVKVNTNVTCQSPFLMIFGNNKRNDL